MDIGKRILELNEKNKKEFEVGDKVILVDCTKSFMNDKFRREVINNKDVFIVAQVKNKEECKTCIRDGEAYNGYCCNTSMNKCVHVYGIGWSCNCHFVKI